MNRWRLAACLVCAVSVPVWATSQAPDRIRIEGQEHTLLGNPLEALWQGESRFLRPDFQERPAFGHSTANWRGYVATFEVADGKLWLVSIKAYLYRGPGIQHEGRTDEQALKAFYEEARKPEYWAPVTLEGLFPGKAKDGRVLADWFTGELRVGLGKILRYAHMGYGSIYEQELFLTVKRGLVTERRLVDHRGKPLPDSLDLEYQELKKMKAAEEKPEPKHVP